MIDTWHLVISGFLQSRNSPTGMTRLWLELHNKFASKTTAVEIHAWNDDFKALAEQIRRVANGSTKPTIYIHGYSWGGMSACHLAKHLWQRNLDVKHMVLSDPVYRHWYKLGWWRAFVPWRCIFVPPNVARVSYFLQRQQRPKGHRLRAINPRSTFVERPVILRIPHVAMDDATEFRTKCNEVSELCTPDPQP